MTIYTRITCLYNWSKAEAEKPESHQSSLVALWEAQQQLHEKIADMDSNYYDLRGKIVQAERRIATLTERGRCGRSTTNTRRYGISP